MARVELIPSALAQFVTQQTGSYIKFSIPSHVQINYFSNMANMMDIFDTVNVKYDLGGGQETTCYYKSGVIYKLESSNKQLEDGNNR